MERVELPSIVQETGKQIILFAGIAVRLAICPGDDIALVAGSFAAGSGHDTGAHEAMMPSPLELDLADKRNRRLPKNLR